MSDSTLPDMSPTAIDARLRAMAGLHAVGMSLLTARPLGPVESLAKDERGRVILGEDWWLRPADFPALVWARSRRLADATADALAPDGVLRLFPDASAAAERLTAEGWRRLDALTAQDEAALGLPRSQLRPPARSQ